MNNSEAEDATQWENPPSKDNANPPNNVALVLYSTFLILIALAVIATIINHVCRQSSSSQVSPSEQQQQQLPSQTESMDVTTQDDREAEEAHQVHMETPRIQQSESPVLLSIRSNRLQEMLPSNLNLSEKSLIDIQFPIMSYFKIKQIIFLLPLEYFPKSM